MLEKSTRKVLSIFKSLYPKPESELHFKNQYELLVSVILSAQCTDKKVNQVTPALFQKFPSFGTLSKAKLHALEEIIRPINYYKTKAKNLVGMGKTVMQVFSGKLPATYQELITLPGVGNKTANVILSELRLAPTFPVDTHVFRVARRLGFSNGKTPDAVEDDLKKLFDKKHWRNLHHWLIFHGRRVCKARTPLCGECKLSSVCPSVNRNFSPRNAG